MNSKEQVSARSIRNALEASELDITPDEGRLKLTELLIKANAGFRNSRTEESFLGTFGLLTKDRRLTLRGSKFICSMLYNHSNLQSEFFTLSEEYRK